jgi:hypothetical protein
MNGVICTVQCVTAPFSLVTRRLIILMVFLNNIASSLIDGDNVIQRRNNFVSQTNNVLCFFNKLNTMVKMKLFKSCCTSNNGAELWALNSARIEIFCVAWRKALRRILQLPYNAHSYFLPILSDTLPVYDEIYKRSMKYNCYLSILLSAGSINCLQLLIIVLCLEDIDRSFLGANALISCNRLSGPSEKNYQHYQSSCLQQKRSSYT